MNKIIYLIVSISVLIIVFASEPFVELSPTLTGYVFWDKNANKQQDFDEVGLADIRVFLDENNNGLYDNGEQFTFTDTYGNYSFKQLLINTAYTVRVMMPFIYSNTSASKEDGIHSQIVGGVSASINDFSFFAALKVLTHNGLTYQCGASLIAGRYLLTAAHCVHDAISAKVLFDSNRYSDIYRRDSFVTNANTFIVHPEYDDLTFENDLALVVLDDVVFRPRVQLFLPDLYPQELLGEGAEVTAIGQGKTSYYGQTSDLLQSVVLSVYPEDYKTGIYEGYGQNTIVAGGKNIGGCSGDSGGPLLLSYKDYWLQVGVTSYAYLCGLEQGPTAFASIPLLWDFVVNNVEVEKSQSVIVSFEEEGSVVKVNFGLFR